MISVIPWPSASVATGFSVFRGGFGLWVYSRPLPLISLCISVPGASGTGQRPGTKRDNGCQKEGCPVKPCVAFGQTVPQLFWYRYRHIMKHQKTCTSLWFYIFEWFQRSSGFWQGPICLMEDASRHFLVAEAQQKTSAELGAINGVATKGEMEPMAELETKVAPKTQGDWLKNS